ncbi:MAG: hypothetical protein R3F65_33150 [bacterium]
MNRALPLVALALTALGAPFASSYGAVACALGLVAGIAAIRRAAPHTPGRTAGWAATIGAGLALGVAFTVHVAAPNIVIAGQKAAGRQAVATLRTLLWAQDQLVADHGRAGTLGELAAARPLDGAPIEPPLLRPPFKRLVPGRHGMTVDFGGYTYLIYVLDPSGAPTTDGPDATAPIAAGRTAWLAYAWPTRPGRTGYLTYCINRYEDILEQQTGPAYAGPEHPPGWDACVTGADPAGRLEDGAGRDGGTWARWRGKETRRSKASPRVTD